MSNTAVAFVVLASCRVHMMLYANSPRAAAAAADIVVVAVVQVLDDD